MFWRVTARAFMILLALTLALSACSSSDGADETSEAGDTASEGTTAVDEGAEDAVDEGGPTEDDGSGDGGEPASDEPFVFGAVLPLSGPFGAVGEGSLTGLQAQAQVINDQGGILGREVVIESRDSAGDGQQAVSAMRDLLASGEIHAVMSENLGPLSAAVIPLIQEEGIISATTAGSSGVGDKDQFPTNFQFALLPAQQTQMMLAAAQTVGGTSLGIVGFDDDTGRGYVEEIQAAAGDFGFEVVGDPQLLDAQATDYTAQLQVLRDAGAEILVGNMFGAPIGVLAQGLLDLGWSEVTVVGTPGFPAAPLDVLVPEEAWDQIMFATPPAGAYDGELSEDQQVFVDAVEATGGELATLLAAASTADLLTGIWYAYETAGELDSAAAITAMEGMSDDPAAQDYPWLFFGAEGPMFSAEYHYPELVDVQSLTWLAQAGEPLSGAFPGAPLD